jgi:acyl-CoA synthetase (AMP-forming)/AMP-acid ligase II
MKIKDRAKDVIISGGENISVVFAPLPKTSTGKILKHILRDRARSASAID